MPDDHKDEKIGRAIVNLRWLIFAAKCISTVTVVSLVVLFFLEKPLWIAPVIGVGAYIVYRVIWRLICRLIGWSAGQ